MKALVLSGGGAHGAYEAGVAQALLAHERYDVICGVSIGAINAALIAAGTTGDALERFWRDEFPTQAIVLFPYLRRLRRLVRHLRSFGSGRGWEGAVRVARAATELPFLTNLGNLHKTSLPAVADSLGKMVDFARLRTPLLIGAANVTYGCASVFRAGFDGSHQPVRSEHLVEYHDLNDDNFVMALLASAAMPGLFSPIELTFDGRPAFYADGSLVHASPLGIAVDNGATEVTVIFVDQELDPQTATAAQNVAQQAYNIATLWQQRLLQYELRLAQATNELVRLGGAPGKREIRIRYVRPSVPIDVDLLAFDDAPALAKLFAQGLADGATGPSDRLAGHETKKAGKSPQPFWNSVRRLFTRKPLDRGASA
jgi:predicted acylesterase/phospholipase RssA